MPSLTSFLATGTLFALNALAQNTAASSASSSAARATPLEAGIAADTVLRGPSSTTTTPGVVTPSDATPIIDIFPTPATKLSITAVTIDGTVFVPSTLCGAGSTLTEPTTTPFPTPGRTDDVTLIEPSTRPSNMPSGDVTLIQPTTTPSPTPGRTDGATLVEPSTRASASSSPHSGGVTLIEPTTTPLPTPGRTDGATLIEPSVRPSSYSSVPVGGTTLESSTTPTTTPPAGSPTSPSDSSSTHPSSSGTVALPTPSSTPGYDVSVELASSSRSKSKLLQIPTDNTLTLVQRGRGFKADTLQILSIAEDGETISCTAFNDKKGLKPLGEPVAAGEVGDVTLDGEEKRVRAVQCGPLAVTPRPIEPVSI